jgi:putative ABC transport system ATP-binding protein
MKVILNVQHLTKSYVSGNDTLTVLDNITFSVMEGEIFSIVGPSGSGKTTLLGLCAGLDNASSGSISINGSDLNKLNEEEKAKLRNKNIGFIFQNFQLLPSLTALENVMVPIELKKEKGAKARAMDLLNRVGLAQRKDHYPVQLSGGEQQRISLARAFSNRPAILFADEPTGNLDGETGEKMIELIFSLNKEMGTTLALVTHDMELAARTQRILSIKNGKLVADQLTASI